MLDKALGGDSSGVDLGVLERRRIGQGEGHLAASRRDAGGALDDIDGASGRDLLFVVREQRQVIAIGVRAVAEGLDEVEGAVGHRGGCVGEGQAERRDVFL